MLRRLDAVRPHKLPASERVRHFAGEILLEGKWTKSRFADMLHVGYAVFGRADALVTWDLGDLARKRMRRVLATVARRHGVPAPRIGTPEEVAGWLGLEIG